MLQGWLQIALFVVVLVALVAGRRLHGARLHRRARLPHPGPRADRAPHLPGAARAARRRGPGLEGLRPQRDRLLALLLARALPDPAHPGHPAVQPARASTPAPGTSASTPPPRSSPTPTGSTTAARRRSPTSPRWPGWRCRTSSRPRSGSPSSIALIRGIVARSGRALGNFWQDLVRTLLYVLLPISIVGALFLVSQGVIQNLSDATVDPHPRRRHPDPRPGPGRLAGGDQGARHQRRRLLQRQLRLPVREPERPHQLLRDAADPAHPGQPHLHLRAHGRQPAPGLGDLLGDVRPLRRRRRRRLHGRAARHRRPARRRPPHPRLRRLDRRQPGGQGAALRHRRLLALDGGHHGHLAAAPSTAPSSR